MSRNWDNVSEFGQGVGTSNETTPTLSKKGSEKPPRGEGGLFITGPILAPKGANKDSMG